MKKLILITLVLTAAFFTNAQNSRFGFSAGAAFSNYHSKVDGESEDGNTLTGITGGVLIDIPLSKNFSFQPALNFVQKGTKDEQTFGGVTEKVKFSINSIEVPLNFLYNATGNTGTFFIGAGPSLTFSISGKWKYDDGTNSLTEDVKFGSGEDDDMKGLDLGANFLTGYRFPNGLFLAANYNAGLNNLFSSSTIDGTLKSHYFGIRLGWLLNGRQKNTTP